MKRKKRKLICIPLLISIIFLFGSASKVILATESKNDGVGETSSEIYNWLDNSEPIYSQLLEYYENMGYSDVDATITLLPESAVISEHASIIKGLNGNEGNSVVLYEEDTVEWQFNVENEGLYSIEVEYLATEGNGAKIQRKLLIDGKVPFSQANNVSLYRYFEEVEEVGVNAIGDEVWPHQEEVVKWLSWELYDSQGYHSEPLYFYLSKGVHSIKFEYVDQPLAIKQLNIKGKQTLPVYSDVKADYENAGYKTVDKDISIYFEAEESKWRNESVVRRESNSDPKTVPFSLTTRKLNTLGGSRWNRGEQVVSWEFEVLESGLYQIGLKVLQNKDVGMPSYRKILIDGEVPFEEFLLYEFPFSDEWYGEVLSDNDNNPYLVYLEKGVHQISLVGQLGPIAEIIEKTTEDIQTLSAITRDIIMITGTDPDPNYEYELYRTIPDLSDNLANLANKVEECADLLSLVSNQKTSSESNYRQIVDQLRKFSDDVDYIPKALGQLESVQTSLGTYINSLKKTPLSLDYFELLSADTKFKVEKSNFFERLWVSIVNFFLSFFKDYDAIGAVEKNGDSELKVIDVWIGRGAEWGEILKEMIDEEFTPQTGIHVNLNVIPGGQLSTGGVNVLLLSLASDSAPDAALSVEYSLPTELAFREAAADLTRFEGYEEVVSAFYDSALIPYKFKGGLYALPETMDFTVMFYRKDIMAELGIKIPDTWSELYQEVLPALYQNSMSFGFPVDTSVSSSSPAALRGYTMFLLQGGGTYYSPDGRASALDTPQAYKAFKMWTELYSQYGVDDDSNIFSRMRSGAMPIGIGNYTNYIQFLTSAPELYGRWGIAPVPGMPSEDGSVNRVVGTMAATANVILNQSDKKEEAWEFLSWWMSEETQVKYGRELEAIIGQSARWNTANVDAFYSLPWSTGDKEVIRYQMDSAKEQYIVPGGYFTSRHIINAWNRVVVNNENSRDALEEAVKDINTEITVKIKEFNLTNEQIIQE